MTLAFRHSSRLSYVEFHRVLVSDTTSLKSPPTTFFMEHQGFDFIADSDWTDAAKRTTDDLPQHKSLCCLVPNTIEVETSYETLRGNGSEYRASISAYCDKAFVSLASASLVNRWIAVVQHILKARRHLAVVRRSGVSGIASRMEAAAMYANRELEDCAECIKSGTVPLPLWVRDVRTAEPFGRWASSQFVSYSTRGVVGVLHLFSPVLMDRAFSNQRYRMHIKLEEATVLNNGLSLATLADAKNVELTYCPVGEASPVKFEDLVSSAQSGGQCIAKAEYLGVRIGYSSVSCVIGRVNMDLCGKAESMIIEANRLIRAVVNFYYYISYWLCVDQAIKKHDKLFRVLNIVPLGSSIQPNYFVVVNDVVCMFSFLRIGFKSFEYRKSSTTNDESNGIIYKLTDLSSSYRVQGNLTTTMYFEILSCSSIIYHAWCSKTMNSPHPFCGVRLRRKVASRETDAEELGRITLLGCLLGRNPGEPDNSIVDCRSIESWSTDLNVKLQTSLHSTHDQFQLRFACTHLSHLMVYVNMGTLYPIEDKRDSQVEYLLALLELYMSVLYANSLLLSATPLLIHDMMRLVSSRVELVQTVFVAHDIVLDNSPAVLFGFPPEAGGCLPSAVQDDIRFHRYSDFKLKTHVPSAFYRRNTSDVSRRRSQLYELLRRSLAHGSRAYEWQHLIECQFADALMRNLMYYLDESPAVPQQQSLNRDDKAACQIKGMRIFEILKHRVVCVSCTSIACYQRMNPLVYQLHVRDHKLYVSCNVPRVWSFSVVEASIVDGNACSISTSFKAAWPNERENYALTISSSEVYLAAPLVDLIQRYSSYVERIVSMIGCLSGAGGGGGSHLSGRKKYHLSLRNINICIVSATQRLVMTLGKIGGDIFSESSSGRLDAANCRCFLLNSFSQLLALDSLSFRISVTTSDDTNVSISTTFRATDTSTPVLAVTLGDIMILKRLIFGTGGVKAPPQQGGAVQKSPVGQLPNSRSPGCLSFTVEVLVPSFIKLIDFHGLCLVVEEGKVSIAGKTETSLFVVACNVTAASLSIASRKVVFNSSRLIHSLKDQMSLSVLVVLKNIHWTFHNQNLVCLDRVHSLCPIPQRYSTVQIHSSLLFIASNCRMLVDILQELWLCKTLYQQDTYSEVGDPAGTHIRQTNGGPQNVSPLNSNHLSGSLPWAVSLNVAIESVLVAASVFNPTTERIICSNKCFTMFPPQTTNVCDQAMSVNQFDTYKAIADDDVLPIFCNLLTCREPQYHLGRRMCLVCRSHSHPVAFWTFGKALQVSFRQLVDSMADTCSSPARSPASGSLETVIQKFTNWKCIPYDHPDSLSVTVSISSLMLVPSICGVVDEQLLCSALSLADRDADLCRLIRPIVQTSLTLHMSGMHNYAQTTKTGGLTVSNSTELFVAEVGQVPQPPPPPLSVDDLFNVSSRAGSASTSTDQITTTTTVPSMLWIWSLDADKVFISADADEFALTRKYLETLRTNFNALTKLLNIETPISSYSEDMKTTTRDKTTTTATREKQVCIKFSVMQGSLTLKTLSDTQFGKRIIVSQQLASLLQRIMGIEEHHHSPTATTRASPSKPSKDHSATISDVRRVIGHGPEAWLLKCTIAGLFVHEHTNRDSVGLTEVEIIDILIECPETESQQQASFSKSKPQVKNMILLSPFSVFDEHAALLQSASGEQERILFDGSTFRDMGGSQRWSESRSSVDASTGQLKSASEESSGCLCRRFSDVMDGPGSATSCWRTSLEGSNNAFMSTHPVSSVHAVSIKARKRDANVTTLDFQNVKIAKQLRKFRSLLKHCGSRGVTKYRVPIRPASVSRTGSTFFRITKTGAACEPFGNVTLTVYDFINVQICPMIVNFSQHATCSISEFFKSTYSERERSFVRNHTRVVTETAKYNIGRTSTYRKMGSTNAKQTNHGAPHGCFLEGCLDESEIISEESEILDLSSAILNACTYTERQILRRSVSTASTTPVVVVRDQNPSKMIVRDTSFCCCNSDDPEMVSITEDLEHSATDDIDSDFRVNLLAHFRIAPLRLQFHYSGILMKFANVPVAVESHIIRNVLVRSLTSFATEVIVWDIAKHGISQAFSLKLKNALNYRRHSSRNSTNPYPVNSGSKYESAPHAGMPFGSESDSLYRTDESNSTSTATFTEPFTRGSSARLCAMQAGSTSRSTIRRVFDRDGHQSHTNRKPQTSSSSASMRMHQVPQETTKEEKPASCFVFPRHTPHKFKNPEEIQGFLFKRSTPLIGSITSMRRKRFMHHHSHQVPSSSNSEDMSLRETELDDSSIIQEGDGRNCTTSVMIVHHHNNRDTV